MTNPITLVLFSLVFNGCNDVTYKKYALKVRSRGLMIAGAGAVWGIWQTVFLQTLGPGLAFDAATASFGIACGLVLVLANILYLECLAHLDISLGTTIYRLNTIGVVVMSWLFLGESLGLYKLAAIALGITAVIILYKPPAAIVMAGSIRIFLLLIIGATLLRSSYGIIAKYAVNHGAGIQAMVPYTALCWVAGGLAYAWLKERTLEITPKLVIYAVASGSLIFLTVATLMQAISLADVSTVIPIANCSFIIALLLSALLKLEAITKRKLIAITMAAASIIMLSRL